MTKQPKKKNITEPMHVALINAQLNDGVLSLVFPAGQMRLIGAGLERRGLVEYDDAIKNYRLTDSGWLYGVKKGGPANV